MNDPIDLKTKKIIPVKAENKFKKSLVLETNEVDQHENSTEEKPLILTNEIRKEIVSDNKTENQTLSPAVRKIVIENKILNKYYFKLAVN